MIVSDVQERPGMPLTQNSVLKTAYTLCGYSRYQKAQPCRTRVEYYGVRRALRAIDRADVVLLVLNAEEGIVEQDKKIAGYIEESGKGVIIILNKWDLVADIKNRRHYFENLVREQLSFLSYAPIHYISALTGEGLGKIMPLVDAVHVEQNKMISTGNLNSWLSETLFLNPPPSGKGGLKVFYVTQVAVRPPVFVFFVNNTKLVHFSYKRYLENQLREAYGFEGTP